MKSKYWPDNQTLADFDDLGSIRKQLLAQYELRLRVQRRIQNLRYLLLGSAIGTALFWAFWAAVWL